MLRLVTRSGRGVLGARLSLLAAAAAATALAAGCATATTAAGGGGAQKTPQQTASRIASAPPAPASGTPAPTTTTGPPIVPGQPACAGWPANVVHVAALPASFAPVAVIRCVAGYQTIPGKGQWETATLERAGKDLAPLIAALRHPSVRRAPGTICPALAVLPQQLVLVDGAGKAVWPQLPVDGCGLVQDPVLVALSGLHWQTVSVRLISQVQTQQEVASGCAPQYKDPFTLYGSLRPSAGGAVFPAVPGSLRVCVYNSGGAAGTPRFTGSATVTGAAERELLAGLSGAGQATVCALPEPGFAVIEGSGAPGATGATPVYVELGGCHRVLRYGSQGGGLMGLSAGQASPGAVATIESVTARR